MAVYCVPTEVTFTWQGVSGFRTIRMLKELTQSSRKERNKNSVMNATVKTHKTYHRRRVIREDDSYRKDREVDENANGLTLGWEGVGREREGENSGDEKMKEP